MKLKRKKESKNNEVENCMKDAMSSSIISSADSAIPSHLNKDAKVDEIMNAIEDALTSSVLKNPSQESRTHSQVPHIKVIDNYSNARLWQKKGASISQDSVASGIRYVRKA